MDLGAGVFLLHKKGTRCENSRPGHTFKSTTCRSCRTRRVDWYFLGIKRENDDGSAGSPPDGQAAVTLLLLMDSDYKRSGGSAYRCNRRLAYWVVSPIEMPAGGGDARQEPQGEEKRGNDSSKRSAKRSRKQDLGTVPSSNETDQGGPSSQPPLVQLPPAAQPDAQVLTTLLLEEARATMPTEGIRLACSLLLAIHPPDLDVLLSSPSGWDKYRYADRLWGVLQGMRWQDVVAARLPSRHDLLHVMLQREPLSFNMLATAGDASTSTAAGSPLTAAALAGAMSAGIISCHRPLCR